jgi:hypothetical protein
MDETLQICLIGVLVVLAGCSSVPVGGDGSSGGGTTMTPTDAGGQVNSEIVSSLSVTTGSDNVGRVTLKVTVEASADDAPLRVLVSNPQDNTAGETILSESDLLDGSEMVEIPVGSSPTGGEYTIFVRQTDPRSDQDVVTEKAVSFQPGDPVVGDVTVSGQAAEMGNGYILTSADVVISNSGDFPLRVTDVTIFAPSSKGFIPILEQATVAPGETRVFSTSETAALPRPSDPQTTLEIVVAYGDGEQVSKSVRIDIR